MRNLAVDVAIAATRKVLTEQIDERRSAGLVDQAIAELPTKLH